MIVMEVTLSRSLGQLTSLLSGQVLRDESYCRPYVQRVLSGAEGSDSPRGLHHRRAGKEAGQILRSAQRGDVTAERRGSPPPTPPPPSCPYLTWRHRPLPLLCVRVCVRRRWRRGQVGPRSRCSWRSSGRCRCPEVSDCRADEGPATVPPKPPQLAAGPGGRVGERVSEGAARAGGRAPARERGGGGGSAAGRAGRGMSMPDAMPLPGVGDPAGPGLKFAPDFSWMRSFEDASGRG
ncbi:uncharacterized protein LOC110596424 [Carlito syrichta]|uniref:Uncharacterized protein LOC110596424 n=1 Tax=Carlito syrichta TaxID=1868482 RepID=A0A3Q0EEP2_CARSF|nr:uncharacterized protein LOC110596424 [Carlito syrichta]